MSLKTFLIILAVLALLFVIGIGAAVRGGKGAVSGDSGFARTIGHVFGAPKLKTSDVDIVAGGPACVEGNSLTVRVGTQCSYELKGSVFRSRTLALGQAIPAATIVVTPPNEVAVSKGLPTVDTFEVFIERKRHLVVLNRTSRFTVTCTGPPNGTKCTFPLK